MYSPYVEWLNSSNAIAEAARHSPVVCVTLPVVQVRAVRLPLISWSYLGDVMSHLRCDHINTPLVPVIL